MKFVIWSFEHDAWWGPDECGYVDDLARAGRYDSATAGRIVVNSVFLDEVAIIESIAEGKGPPTYHVYNGVGVESSQ